MSGKLSMLENAEIVSQLRKKDLSSYPDPSRFKPLGQALWVLVTVKDNLKIKELRAEGISYVLAELKEIQLDEIAIARAFARASGKVRIHKTNRALSYEIMAAGREFLGGSKCSDLSGEVLFFTGENAWSDANEQFPKMIAKLQGNLCVVDPYYGHGTFYLLRKFGNERSIRFLSREMGAKEQKDVNLFRNDLQRFKKEFKNVELKRYTGSDQLHDRYIIADNALIIIGHGIKDIATKESFVVFLAEQMVQGFLPTLKQAFERRWRKSADIV
jgi:hypothetical protein